MLVLTRKKNERIFLTHKGESIVLTVASIDANRIRLGIDAPDGVEIRRDDANTRKLETAIDAPD